MPDTLEGFNDLPIATPACGGGNSIAVAQYAMRCWKSTDDANARCPLEAVSDTGLCERHLYEMRQLTCP